ncbi:MAG: Rrf2 family transcriptional regulator, nitric oxide-sensitive transcriptional repressor [Candidatus Sumerlaeota bacterium]|nr:Rrf2 family transcriptional regulator, nitric oxide-sensitive transcriptional repressor [Candidatus Sumerlaeota bacterium]
MISTTGEYALRAAVYLAQHYDAPQTTAQIAEGTRVPQGYLSKILQAMVRRDLVTSQRGLGGGFVLIREPREVTVLEVLASVDAAPERIRKCPLGLEGHTKLCPVHRLVDEAIAHAETAFESADLESLSRSTRGVRALCEESGPKQRRATTTS